MFRWLRTLRESWRSQRILGNVDGDIRIDRVVELIGNANGKVFVVARGNFLLSGNCLKDVIINPNGKATLCGAVLGNVTNYGGELIISGMVHGKLNASAGETHLHANTKVAGGIEGALILSCPQCSQKLRVPGEHPQLRVTCTACKTAFDWQPKPIDGVTSNFANISPEVVSGLFNQFFGQAPAKPNTK